MDQRSGRSKTVLALGVGPQPETTIALASEVDDGAKRNARAIRRTAGIVKADVVELRAQCQVGQNGHINSAADTIGEIRSGAAARACGQMRGTREKLNKGTDLGWVVHDDARAKEKRVGVQGCTYSAPTAV